VLIQAHLADGKTLPFGAEVEDEQSQVVGAVGQAGRIMARVSHQAGRLGVQWQDAAGNTHRCTFAYQAPTAAAGAARYSAQDASCREPGAMPTSEMSHHE